MYTQTHIYIEHCTTGCENFLNFTKISERDLVSSSFHIIYLFFSLFYIFYAYIMNTFQLFIIYAEVLIRCT